MSQNNGHSIVLLGNSVGFLSYCDVRGGKGLWIDEEIPNPSPLHADSSVCQQTPPPNSRHRSERTPEKSFAVSDQRAHLYARGCTGDEFSLKELSRREWPRVPRDTAENIRVAGSDIRNTPVGTAAAGVGYHEEDLEGEGERVNGVNSATQEAFANKNQYWEGLVAVEPLSYGFTKEGRSTTPNCPHPGVGGVVFEKLATENGCYPTNGLRTSISHPDNCRALHELSGSSNRYSAR